MSILFLSESKTKTIRTNSLTLQIQYHLPYWFHLLHAVECVLMWPPPEVGQVLNTHHIGYVPGSPLVLITQDSTFLICNSTETEFISCTMAILVTIQNFTDFLSILFYSISFFGGNKKVLFYDWYL